MPLSPNAVTGSDPARDWPALMQEIGPRFAQRAGACDAGDHFVAENFSELKVRGVFAAGVPAELGGGGASYPELCDMLRTLARYCSSTALALSMHTHVVATAAWRWRRNPQQPFERLLRRIAEEKLVLVTRRVRLAQGIRNGRTRRGRLADQRSQDFCQRHSRRRPVHDAGGLRRS
jgi:alkylation response protein AidB-like acyl-CoA dehydrogenase